MPQTRGAMAPMEVVFEVQGDIKEAEVFAS